MKVEFIVPDADEMPVHGRHVGERSSSCEVSFVTVKISAAGDRLRFVLKTTQAAHLHPVLNSVQAGFTQCAGPHTEAREILMQAPAVQEKWLS